MTNDVLKSLSFVMDFKDPATLYIESLINMHNNIMWYLVLILTIVYWTLYIIISESNWTVLNRQVGFLRIYLRNRLFIVVNSFYLWFNIKFWSTIMVFTYKFFRDSVFVAPTINASVDRLSFFSKFFFFFLDADTHKSGTVPPYWVFESDINLRSHYADLWQSKYLDHFLFTATNKGYLEYGRVTGFDSSLSYRYSPFLTVQKFKHSTLLEIAWATFPSVIILLILVPSILLIYSIDEDLDPEFTIKVIGHQWFWSYEFDGWLPISALHEKFPHVPSLVEFLLDDPASYTTFEFDSCMIITDSLVLGQKRLLEVDNPLVVPCNIGLRFLITSADVLHAWALPQLGIKVDAVPGRLSQYISMVRRPGVFYGQCSEICGVAHAFMPIVLHGKTYAYVLPVWTDFVETPNFEYPTGLKRSRIGRVR